MHRSGAVADSQQRDLPGPSSMSEATRRRRAQRLHTRVCLDAGLWQAKRQALVFRTIQTIDPLGSEILARLQAIVPAVAVQVTEAFDNGNPCHSAAGLLKPELHLMHTAAKHEYSRPFSQLNPKLVRTLRRRREQRVVPPPPPPPIPEPPCDDGWNNSSKDGSPSATEALPVQELVAAPRTQSDCSMPRSICSLTRVEKQAHKLNPAASVFVPAAVELPINAVLNMHGFSTECNMRCGPLLDPLPTTEVLGKSTDAYGAGSWDSFSCPVAAAQVQGGIQDCQAAFGDVSNPGARQYRVSTPWPSPPGSECGDSEFLSCCPSTHDSECGDAVPITPFVSQCRPAAPDSRIHCVTCGLWTPMDYGRCLGCGLFRHDADYSTKYMNIVGRSPQGLQETIPHKVSDSIADSVAASSKPVEADDDRRRHEASELTTLIYEIQHIKIKQYRFPRPGRAFKLKRYAFHSLPAPAVAEQAGPHFKPGSFSRIFEQQAARSRAGGSTRTVRPDTRWIAQTHTQKETSNSECNQQ